MPDSVSNPRENDIFISYARQDLEFVKRLDAALRHQHRDPWVDWEDIPMAAAEQWQHIEEGIQNAEVFVFVVSPDSIGSDENRAELELASKFNKQLVPILWRQIPAEDMPGTLRDLDWLPVETISNSEILEAIAKKIVHIQIDRRLLIRANAWQSRGCSEDLLLQGKDLQALQAWINQNTDLTPQLTLLQTQYLEASAKAKAERSSPGQPGIFISYSRRDEAFVQKLYQALKKAAQQPWLDKHNIPVAADWMLEIKEAIEGAHTFLFVVSPDSVASGYCRAEIEHAIKCNKRLISIEWRQGFDIQNIDSKLAKYQWIKFNPQAHLESAHFEPALEDVVTHLLAAVKTDLNHVKTHTRLLVRAIEWDAQKRREDLLLHRQALAEAKRWLAKYSTQEPAPTLLHKQYINTSHQIEAKHKTRNGLLGVCLAAAICGFSLFGLTAAIGEIEAMVASLEGNRGLDALITGIRAGKRLKRYGWIVNQLNANLQLRVVTVLNQEINNLRELNRLQDHQERIYDVQFSPDDQLIASAGEDGKIILWKTNGERVRILQEHTADVVSIAFSPDGQLLASGSYDGTVRLWNVNTGDLVTTLTATSKSCSKVLRIGFSPNGQLLAAGCNDGRVRLWNQQGRFITELTHSETNAVTSISFSLDGKKLASAGIDGTVKLWTWADNSVTTLKHDRPVIDVSFSPDGQTLASADVNGIVKLWQPNGKLIKTLQGHEGVVYRVVFSPDSRVIASASDDGTVRLWRRDGTPWQDNGPLSLILRGHQDAVYRVQFSPDSYLVATAGADDTIKIWSRDDGSLLNNFVGHRDEILGIAFSNDGTTVASASKDKTVRLWNLDNPVQILPHNNRVYDVSFHPNGKTVVSSGYQSIKLWQTDGTLLQAYQKAHEREDILSLSFAPQWTATGPSQSLLASAGTDGKIKLWKLNQARLEQHKVLSGHQGKVSSLSFSPTEQLLVSAGADGWVKLWHLDGTIAAEFKVDDELEKLDVFSVHFSPDGKMLASASEDGAVKLWHLDGSLINELKKQDSAVYDVSFSQDGKTLATAGEDGTVKLWQMDGRLIKSLSGHADPVLKVDFHPNEKLLASASQDGTVKLWTAEGVLIMTLRGHRREVNSIGFSPDGATLASASFDKTALLWQLPDRFDNKILDDLLVRGCKLAKDYLMTNPNIKNKDRKLCSAGIKSSLDRINAIN
ncbi:MAG: TIR domain-containing protein [Cyanothece sp. SIO1E1]|nr:TIR domain-containing protein [Cyanothece sp. SIO1E1]